MTTPRYTREQITQLYDNKEWNTLWRVVIEPMVKHTVKRCMQEGLDPFYVRDDLMQEAYLAAWECLPRWNAFEGGLRTWIAEKVRSAVANSNIRATNGMIGGRDSGKLVVSMYGDAPIEDDSTNDEQVSLLTPEAKMVYRDVPGGYGDPAEEGEDERMLAMVPEEDRDMVRRLCGIGVPAETQEEYARAEGISPRTVRLHLQQLQNYFCRFSRKTVKRGIWELIKSGDVSDGPDTRAA